MEDKNSLLEHYREMRAGLLTAIEGLTNEQLSEPSVDGWSVKDHLAHISLWDEFRAADIARISAGHLPAWKAMSEEQNEAHNQLIRGLRADLTPDQVRWELATTHQRVLDAIAEANDRGLTPSLYGDAALRSTHEAAHSGWIRRWREVRGL